MRATVCTTQSDGLKVDNEKVTNECRAEGGGGVSDEIVCPSGHCLIGMWFKLCGVMAV